ncbi:conjugal transfer protein TraF [Marinobacter sp. 1Y8]
MRLSRLALAIGLGLVTTQTFAGPQTFTTARSFAMGGTGVAVAHPASANTSNPAMMAAKHHEWADDFGVIFPSVNARFADDDEVLDQIDAIQDTIDRINESASNSNIAGVQQGAGALEDQLRALNQDTARADAGLGFSIALPLEHFSVGVFADASLRATTRGNTSESDLLILDQIENNTATAATVNDISDQLNSEGTIIAAAVGEFGISIAHAFEIAENRTLSVGVSPKYVQLRTFEYQQNVSDFEDDDFDADEYQTDDGGFNVDLGAAYAFGNEQNWTAGLAVRNLIPMDLESNSGRTFELDPTVTAGIAHQGSMHVLTAEVDLTENKAFGYGDDTQWLALGAEFDVFRHFQLRGGVRQNLASNDNNDGIEETTQFTFGVGVSPFGAHLELSGLVSDTEMGAAIELGAAF